MYGLSFLTENYSHQNAKKIMSTHQLLADVYSVKKVLHGLQLKMDILQYVSLSDTPIFSTHKYNLLNDFFFYLFVFVFFIL